MTDLLTESAAVMQELVTACSRMTEGVYPAVSTINIIEAKLVDLYYRTGEIMAHKFSAKEQANLRRKLTQSKTFMQIRRDKEIKMAAKDAETESMLAVGEELQAEIDTAAEYEHYRLLRASLQNAFDYARSLSSQLRK